MHMRGWENEAAQGLKTKEQEELSSGNLAGAPAWDAESFGVPWRVSEREVP